MHDYEFIIAGGGVAGLSLAHRLVNSPLRNRSILIIDRDAKDQNDRRLGFWSDRPTPFDDIAWRRLRTAGEGFERVSELDRYRYRMIQGIDFYRHVHRALADYPNVRILRGTVDHIEDGENGAAVWADGQRYTGRWVFDSLFKLSAFDPGSSRLLHQHFAGWEIETDAPAFDPQTATLMDFDTPQHGEMRFFYVMPFSTRRALVEYVHLGGGNHEHALRTYITNVLGVKAYRVVAREGGVLPMCNFPFPRRTGRHIMTTGAKGGMIKPSSGYGFTRIQRDSDAVVRSLLRHGHPFAVPRGAAFFRLCDTAMLHALQHRGDWFATLFVTLFKYNPIERVFRFLDETASPWECLCLTASLFPQLVALPASQPPALPSRANY
jgi:lycopene beta-cyclase